MVDRRNGRLARKIGNQFKLSHYRNFEEEDLCFGYYYDRETGLPIGDHWPEEDPLITASLDAYTTRIRELLDEHGIPAWSMKSHLVPADVLVAFLGSEDMQEVTRFPYKVNEGLQFVVGHQGWEQGFVLAVSSLTGTHKIQNTQGEPFYVATHNNWPDTIFVRNGNWRVIAYYKHGYSVGFVFRMPTGASIAEK